MEHLQPELDHLLGSLPDAEQIRSRLDNLVSVYPFNEYEFIISHLKGQHRGNVGEGQLHVTHENIRAFDSYAVQPNKLAEAIREAYKRQETAKKPG